MPLPTFYPDDSGFEYRLRKYRKSPGYEASVCRRRKRKQLRKTATRKPHRKRKHREWATSLLFLVDRTAAGDGMKKDGKGMSRLDG
ncbi:hypothetical protein CEK26_003668 [Fusarium fujikuroi]|nr:hypothetical protein CEK27_003660 [Fusarium fujikuroi]QGI88665.1 hypothetical protein CEK25_003621 [Fusarium fujikuroi]QGJ02224.1 hypothetical protein CEK26_003668 [Fusarium fujikuroi]